MSSVKVAPVSRSRTTTRAVPSTTMKRSSWPRSWKWSPRMTPCREKTRFVWAVGFGSALSRRSSLNHPRSSSKRSSGTRTMPATLIGSSVRARVLDEPADLREVLPVLARVLPPAFDAHDVETALLGVVAVDVRDLELAAVGRLEALDQVEHVRREAVEADDGVAGRRRLVAGVDDAGLLDDVRDASVAVVGDDAEVLRVRHLLDEDHRPVFPRPEPPDRVGLRALEDVVAENDHELLAPSEVAGHADHLRDPARLRLDLVGQVERQQRRVGAPLADPPV